MPKYLQDLTFSISVLLITNLISSFFRGVRGEIDLGGTGMLSRQDWVEVRGAATGPVARERLRREAHGRGGGGPPPENVEKLITGNAFSKHFRRFLVTLKEWVIPPRQNHLSFPHWRNFTLKSGGDQWRRHDLVSEDTTIGAPKAPASRR